MAYNIDDDCGQVGDDFFRACEPITSHVPYIWGVGDHEGGRVDINGDCR